MKMSFSQFASTFQFLRGRSRLYRAKFLVPDNDPVLTDLARFCYAAKTTFHEDPAEQARREGRREVWLRIQEHLHLTAGQLFVIYNHPSVVEQYSRLQQEEQDA